MGTMSKEEILKILEDAKDKNSDVPMRLVRQAFEKLPEPCKDTISRQAAIEVLRNRWLKTRNYDGIGEDIAEECEIYLKTLPSAHQNSGGFL